MTIPVEVGGGETKGRSPLGLRRECADFESVSSVEEHRRSMPLRFDASGSGSMRPEKSQQAPFAVGFV